MPPATYQLVDNDLLYYLHIPKTAGTSFTDVLKAHIKPSESSFGLPIGDFAKLPPDIIAKYKAISGHYFYDIQAFTARSPVYITMLRNPLERTISIYSHIRRSPTHYLYEIVKSQSLLEFATDPRMFHFYVNTQTRYIGASPNIREIVKNLKPNALTTSELERQMQSFAPNGFSDPALLEKAQERLRKFAFVGLTEQFDEAIEVLCYTFGWPVPTAAKVLNVSPNRPKSEDVPQEAIDVIRDNTQFDTTLYETGKQLFNGHYEQMLKDYPEKRPNPTEIADPLAKLQRENDFQKRLINTLQEEKLILEARIRELDAVIDQHERSFGWRFVLHFNKLRLKFIPKGSKREHLYLKIRDR